MYVALLCIYKITQIRGRTELLILEKSVLWDSEHLRFLLADLGIVDSEEHLDVIGWSI